MYTHRELEFHRQAQGSRLGKTNKQTKQQPTPPPKKKEEQEKEKEEKQEKNLHMRLL